MEPETKRVSQHRFMHKTLVWCSRTSEQTMSSVLHTYLCSHQRCTILFLCVNNLNLTTQIVSIMHIIILYMQILEILFDQHQWPLLGTGNKLRNGSFFQYHNTYCQYISFFTPPTSLTEVLLEFLSISQPSSIVLLFTRHAIVVVYGVLNDFAVLFEIPSLSFIMFAVSKYIYLKVTTRFSTDVTQLLKFHCLSSLGGGNYFIKCNRMFMDSPDITRKCFPVLLQVWKKSLLSSPSVSLLL